MARAGGTPDLFGLPFELSRERALALAGDLETAWQAQTGSYPLDVQADLAKLAPYFDPLAREATLRRRLDDLPPRMGELPPELAVDAGEGRQIVTAEGRLALELLRQALAESSTGCSISEAALADALALLADFYRQLARK